MGSTTASLKTSSETKVNVVTQLTEQQQSISGVSLDEEVWQPATLSAVLSGECAGAANSEHAV
ncbi:hypothetical protein ACVXG7_02350 [Enterobacter hormaechei]